MKQVIRSSRIVQLLASVAILVGIASFSYAGGFYVIPAGKCECECDDSSLGEKSFKIKGERYIAYESVFATTGIKLVEIVGITSSSTHISRPDKPGGMACNSDSDGYLCEFRKAPSGLPTPKWGKKGNYYFMKDGHIAHANYL